jgi:transposase InsO family protein
MGYQVIGKQKTCEACELSKAKRKSIKKTMLTRAKTPCERMFVDITGPFSKTLGGTRYWLQIVDDASRMGFCFFLKTKDEIGIKMELFIKQIKVLDKEITTIRCDNAGENISHLQRIAIEYKINIEFTSPHTPEYNGVVERRIASIKQKGHAMMLAANMSEKARELLWAEAVKTANTLSNITMNRAIKQTPYEFFFGKKSKLYENLIQFGRIGYVLDPTKIKANWSEKSEKGIMVGYADGKPSDTYRMYLPKRHTVIETRNVK